MPAVNTGCSRAVGWGVDQPRCSIWDIVVLDILSCDHLIRGIDGCELPWIFHTYTIRLIGIFHIDHNSHLRTAGTDVTWWNHHGIESILIFGNCRHMEHQCPHWLLDHLAAPAIYLQFIVHLYFGRYLNHDKILIVELNDISKFQSRPCRIIVNIDGVLLCQHFANQDFGIILGFENGIRFRELI